MATPHYPQPGYPPPQRQGNGLAVAGMVLGILGLVLCWIPFVGAVCALIGVILGALGMGKAKRIGGTGKGMAIAGLVCGVIGVVAGIIFVWMTFMAVRGFEDYMQKSKSTEASLNLRMIERHVKSYYLEKGTLPPSASYMPGPPGSACLESGGKIPVKSMAAWDQAGWTALEFSVMEPARYSYTWSKISDKSGEIIAAGDLDCDATISTTTVHLEIHEGNLQSTYLDPTPD